MAEEADKLLLVLTHGPEDGGARATLCFSLAVTLQAMGADVIVYLNARAAHWAQRHTQDHIHLPGFDSLATYMDLFCAAEGKLYVCASCLEAVPEDYRASAKDLMRDNVTQAGLATLASLVMERRTLSL